ncbi:hypothetical protein [Bacillus sp. 165]|uniref:hypothetical protein n=1 Tax=Bacillus sp. 165 TaxID=1529117 RepID=UPI001ADA17EA|nr:hypothetical protein [Bacillus sp. 165]MBO9131426.1 hypothetical protein [Bacillus sp. 165]
MLLSKTLFEIKGIDDAFDKFVHHGSLLFISFDVNMVSMINLIALAGQGFTVWLRFNSISLDDSWGNGALSNCPQSSARAIEGHV